MLQTVPADTATPQSQFIFCDPSDPFEHMPNLWLKFYALEEALQAGDKTQIAHQLAAISQIKSQIRTAYNIS